MVAGRRMAVERMHPLQWEKERQSHSRPSHTPSITHSITHSIHHTLQPSHTPTITHSIHHTLQPSHTPTITHSIHHTLHPSHTPSHTPSITHSIHHTLQPSHTPSITHSNHHILQPSHTPSITHSITHSIHHTLQPSHTPTITHSLHHILQPLGTSATKLLPSSKSSDWWGAVSMVMAAVGSVSGGKMLKGWAGKCGISLVSIASSTGALAGSPGGSCCSSSCKVEGFELKSLSGNVFFASSFNTVSSCELAPLVVATVHSRCFSTGSCLDAVWRSVEVGGGRQSNGLWTLGDVHSTGVQSSLLILEGRNSNLQQEEVVQRSQLLNYTTVTVNSPNLMTPLPEERPMSRRVCCLREFSP